MVASHLLKAVDYWRDVGYGDFRLSYWRDREKREVDFIITKKNSPIVAVECKHSDTSFSPSLNHFGKAYPDVPLIQLVNSPNVLRIGANYRIITAWDWLGALI